MDLICEVGHGLPIAGLRRCQSDWVDARSYNWADEIERVTRAYDANKRLVNSGEKFRAHKPPAPRRPSRGGRQVRKVG